MKANYVYLMLVFLFLSCTKEIDVNYHSIDPILVIDAYLNGENGCYVTLSNTVDVEGDFENLHVDSATVVLTNSAGDSNILKNRGRGYYSSPIYAQQGEKYTLDVKLGDQVYSAQTSIEAKPIVSDIMFVRINGFLTIDYLYACIMSINIDETKNNYFKYEIYHNNVPLEWSLFEVKEGASNPYEFSLYFATQKGDKITVDNYSNEEILLSDGDDIRIKIFSLDEASYSYLYSLLASQNGVINPIQMFSGNALGCFIGNLATSTEGKFDLSSFDVSLNQK